MTKALAGNTVASQQCVLTDRSDSSCCRGCPCSAAPCSCYPARKQARCGHRLQVSKELLCKSSSKRAERTAAPDWREISCFHCICISRQETFETGCVHECAGEHKLERTGEQAVENQNRAHKVKYDQQKAYFDMQQQRTISWRLRRTFANLICEAFV